MVGLPADGPYTVNGGSNDPASSGNVSRASQTCDHKCTVITLSIAIPVVSLLLIGLLIFGLLQRRKENEKDQAKDQEREIAMKKLGPESESSSVIENFGDLRAVTNLEDGADAVKEELETHSRSWLPERLTSKTRGWWRM